MRQKSRIIHIITVGVIIFIALLLCAMTINLIKYAKIRNQIEELETKIYELNLEIEQNQGTIDEKSSKEYMERYARELLNLKRRGEKVIKSK